jgi:hypothetical protein
MPYKKGRQALENKLLSPDCKQRKKGIREFDLKNDDKNFETEKINENNKINNINFEDELSINNNNFSEIFEDDSSEKDINI